MALTMQERQHVERGCPSVPPCPEEGQGNHVAGVLCHHGVQSSVCSVPAPHLCKAGDPGRRDAGPPEPFGPRRGVLPHETLSLAQTAEVYYGPAVVEALVWVEHLAGELCGGRLQAGIPELLRALERDHGPSLQYEILKLGNGTKPKETDVIKVDYEGKLIDGTVFDSSIPRKTPSS
jgi:hypothetical protein